MPHPASTVDRNQERRPQNRKSSMPETSNSRWFRNKSTSDKLAYQDVAPAIQMKCRGMNNSCCAHEDFTKVKMHFSMVKHSSELLTFNNDLLIHRIQDGERIVASDLSDEALQRYQTCLGDQNIKRLVSLRKSVTSVLDGFNSIFDSYARINMNLFDGFECFVCDGRFVSWLALQTTNRYRS